MNGQSATQFSGSPVGAPRARIARAVALLLGFALLCFGIVAGGAPAQAAGEHTVSGTIQFPESAPDEIQVPWGSDGGDGYVGVYLTLDKDQPGTVEGWQLGEDANVSFDAATGAWAVTGVPDGDYRLNISVALPNNGNAPGTAQTLTVSGDVALGTTPILEEGRLKAAIAHCGWVTGDETDFYAKNVATGTVYEAMPAQSGWVEPSTDCPPEVSYGNWGFSGLPAGDYIAYSIWNGDTQYYTGLDAQTSSEASAALEFSVKNWEGTALQTLVFPHVVAGTPTISGTAKVGEMLTADSGTWGPAPVTLAYQWQRGGAAISGATATTYKLVAADEGKKISVKVTGSKAGYESESKTSAETAAVAKAVPQPPAKSPFTDVKPTDQFYREIAWMYSSGLSTGIAQPDGSRVYAPKDRVSREAMAAFLYRLSAPQGFTPPAKSPFTDVKPTDKFYREIAWMYSSGLSTGIAQPDGSPVYAPKDRVSREAMAAFLFRIEHPAFSAPGKSPFADVKTTDKFYREIAWMYSSGLSTGIKQPDGSRVYAPKDRVSREAMAAFLYRLETSG